MRDALLRVAVRTPHGIVFQKELRGLRVPAKSGQVGLRPRGEPTVLAVEAGLVIGRAGTAVYFVGTAGGLLTSDGTEVALLTALAVVGDAAEAVLAELEKALAAPNVELEARATIDRLESGILNELRRERSAGRPVRVPAGSE